MYMMPDTSVSIRAKVNTGMEMKSRAKLAIVAMPPMMMTIARIIIHVERDAKTLFSALENSYSRFRFAFGAISYHSHGNQYEENITYDASENEYHDEHNAQFQSAKPIHQ